MSFLKKIIGRRGEEGPSGSAKDPYLPQRVSGTYPPKRVGKDGLERPEPDGEPPVAPEISPEAHDASGLLEDEDECDDMVQPLYDHEPARVTSSFAKDDEGNPVQVGYSWAKTNSWMSDGLVDYGTAPSGVFKGPENHVTSSFRSHASFGSDVTDYEFMMHQQVPMYPPGTGTQPHEFGPPGVTPGLMPMGGYPHGCGCGGDWGGPSAATTGSAACGGWGQPPPGSVAAAAAAMAAAQYNAPLGDLPNDPATIGLGFPPQGGPFSAEDMESYADRMMETARMMKAAAQAQRQQLQQPLVPGGHLPPPPPQLQAVRGHNANQPTIPQPPAPPSRQGSSSSSGVKRPSVSQAAKAEGASASSSAGPPGVPPPSAPSASAPGPALSTSQGISGNLGNPNSNSNSGASPQAACPVVSQGAESQSVDGGASAAQPAVSECPVPLHERTTVMLRNLPNDYSRDMLLDLLDQEGFKGSYDFIYLPQDFKRHAGLGYAFVNLINHEEAMRFREHFGGFNKWRFSSQKICEAAWGAPLQGLEQHIFRYKNSPLMHPEVPDEFKPLLFKDGVRINFPDPTKRIRPPRMKLSATQAAGASAGAGGEENSAPEEASEA